MDWLNWNVLERGGKVGRRFAGYPTHVSKKSDMARQQTLVLKLDGPIANVRRHGRSDGRCFSRTPISMAIAAKISAL